MPKLLLVALAATFLVSGCASQPATTAPPSLPDSRDLSEHPLDVLAIPQP